MSDPFRMDGPTIVSFSGGRTSGYMLWRILQANGGTLGNDIKVAFANTGKEMPQTLDFVRDCGERWHVPITWVEYAPEGFQIKSHSTASRNGEPFKALIDKKGYLPNPVTRFCTSELKIRPSRDFARWIGWDHWTNALGLRADEPRRVAKAKVNRDRWENVTPLATAGITKRDVAAFWAAQNFDLMLPNINGMTPYGNCDLCFLKSAATISGMMRDRPGLAAWWIEAEAEARASKPLGAVFRKDRPSYAALLDAVQRQAPMDFGDADELNECFCHD